MIQDPKDRELETMLKRAEAAARKILGDRGVKYKTPRDIAVEAWIWNEERKISHDFTPTRAYWLAVDYLREEWGRVDKKRNHAKPKVFGSSCLHPSSSVFKDREHPLDLDLIKDQKFRFICEQLMEGRKKDEVAKAMGLSASRISQIIADNAELFGHFVPKELRSSRFAKMCENRIRNKAKRKARHAIQEQGSAAVHVLPDA